MTSKRRFSGYCGGTRAPILIKRISRSASLGLLCLSLFTATAIPSAWSALPSARAGAVSSLSRDGSKTISTPGAAAIGIPAGGSPMAGWPGDIGRYTQPAASNAPYRDSQNAGPSSAAWEMAVVRYRCPANAAVAAVTKCWRSGRSVRGVFSLSSANLASAVRACASAVCFRSSSPWVVNAAIFSADTLRSESQFASLMLDIQTMAIVDATPTARLPISKMLAMSPILFAVSNESDSDGHIRMPFWFPLGAIIFVIIAGIIGIFPPVRRRVV